MAAVFVAAVSTTGCELTPTPAKPPVAMGAPLDATAPRTPPPEALAELLRRLPEVAASEGAGMRADQTELAQQIQAFRSTAIPHVLPLLESREPHIRRFAGYVLRDIEGLTENDLDALIAARKRGDGWIPPAIARVGSPRAIQFLLDDLLLNPQSMTQVTYALRIAGGPAAVQIARVFHTKIPVGDAFASAACEIFRDMGQKAEPAVDALAARARLAEPPLSNRLYAVRLLACIGATARRTIPTLRSLAAAEPDLFGESVREAMFSIGSPDATPEISEALRAQPNVARLRDVAAMGEQGRDAGPAVAALLASPDREIRLAAARALGFIRYSADVASLMRMLLDEDDWQAQYVAAESLGRIQAPSALPALDKVALTHWFPPVRESARLAASVARGRETYPSLKNPHMFGFEFFRYQFQASGAAPGKPPTFKRSPSELTEAELKSLTYEAEIISYGPRGKLMTPKMQTPGTGLRTADGFLVGATRGEWGGELMFVARKSLATRVFDGNVVGVHGLGGKIVVVAGLSHMMTNHGELYVAKPVQPGKYEVSRWKTLPGAPRISGLLPDGSLFVACAGGDVVVDASGRMKMAGAGP